MVYTVKIENRENAIYQVDSKRPLLDSLREQGVDLPYGCKYGGCITCAAKPCGPWLSLPVVFPSLLSL